MIFLICLVALAASALTFFSGFGLGTLLLPAFALFYPIDVAVASTAVVHFLNGLFKLALVGNHADHKAVIRFGVPAVIAALVGAALLVKLSSIAPIATYTFIGGREAVIQPAKLVVGALLIVITALELSPRFASMAVSPQYVPLGGALSGFFGGISGMQGALRSAFLIRLGLSKEAFIGTGVAVAVLIDISRLGIYSRSLVTQRAYLDYALLGAAVFSAFVGAYLGNRLLKKLTLRAIQQFVGAMLAIVGAGLIAGVL
ncbi:MAG TPA: sulfite exporter TauE/SafE family protein [Gemmatimonadaceae bacterium]|nr:sulfite exporter TauE/SafE family protein [Gemmatimonadaceae bacterium]